jgi:probable rRNA maturation factor
VISFPLDEGRRHLGDVVISLDTARRQAREGGWPVSVELRRLLAHGLLHCAGHDHEKPADALRMRRAERRLLGERGMV